MTDIKRKTKTKTKKNIKKPSKTQKQSVKQNVNVNINTTAIKRKYTKKSKTTSQPKMFSMITPTQGMRVHDTFIPPPPLPIEASNNDIINSINSLQSKFQTPQILQTVTKHINDTIKPQIIPEKTTPPIQFKKDLFPNTIPKIRPPPRQLPDFTTYSPKQQYDEISKLAQLSLNKNRPPPKQLPVLTSSSSSSDSSQNINTFMRAIAPKKTQFVRDSGFISSDSSTSGSGFKINKNKTYNYLSSSSSSKDIQPNQLFSPTPSPNPTIYVSGKSIDEKKKRGRPLGSKNKPKL